MTDAAESTEIVVGVDDSPSSQAALEWAARDAKLRQAALVVVYAATLPMGTWPIAPVPTGIMDFQRQIGQDILDDATTIAKQITEVKVNPTRNNRPYEPIQLEKIEITRK